MIAMSTQPRGIHLTMRWLWVAFAVSLVIHFALLFLLSKDFVWLSDSPQDEQWVEVELTPVNQLPVLDVPQPATKEVPDKANFASDKNTKVLEESSGREQSQESLTTRRPRAPSKSKPESFSLSQADILKEGFERQTLSDEQRGAPSEAFLRKLRRGDELKVNAQLFDYGQYINRMRDKLSQRWNARSVISPEMWSQRVVQVSVAVILDKAGEIVELRNLATSRFKAYDEEALRTLRESGPFPNPPKSLIQEDGLVYMTWNFTLNLDGWGQRRNVD
jgi:hypothetical protein